MSLVVIAPRLRLIAVEEIAEIGPQLGGQKVDRSGHLGHLLRTEFGLLESIETEEDDGGLIASQDDLVWQPCERFVRHRRTVQRPPKRNR
jgi:hypothetical protein